ncbi:MAG: hypothetical protein Fur002_12340 [Anaerolineales bacterium]
MQDPLVDLISGDDARAEASLPAVLEMGKAAIPALLELTRSPDPDSRWWAVRALAASPHALPADFILLLSDSAPDVRAAAALALSFHPDENAIPVLTQTLADEDAITAGLAMTALIKIGAPAVPALIEVVEAAPLPAKILALRALSELRDHRAIPILLKSAGAESALMRYWAQIGLEKLGLDMVYIQP